MGGDYTRFSFDPEKNYSAVLRQQGRVGLDADANEAAEIGDRRWRAETMDVIGRCAVPRFTTEDAFKILPEVLPSILPPPRVGLSLEIGNGRMYVDGLLAENHGREPNEFEADLEEEKGTQAYSYSGQPYLPSPPLLAAPAAVAPSRTDLVYLDVWQREVTALQDPEIREVALGGPDTATRLQTVWQVKVLQGVTATACDDELQEWKQATASSAGRLTTSTVAPPPSGDPCVITPEGGYRGLENRLYRVEIHTPGDLDAARFKWSRDNASLVSAVTRIEVAAGPPARTKLTLSSLGRDQMLRFKRNDWVEVVDDHSELMEKPGFMARVAADPLETDRVVTLDRALPAADFDLATPAKRHTRLRRWDQAGRVYDTNGNLLVDLSAASADGLVPLPAAGSSVVLEDGIILTFGLSSAAGEFHGGDHWLFAARTATGKIEELERAAPRGTHHHYCKLALVDWQNPDEPVDCRRHWPPEAGKGCCTVVVAPGEDIEDAIKSLPEKGGCVCLKTGIHPLEEPILIERSDVVLHGESPGATVVRAQGAPFVVVGDPLGQVEVHDVRIEGIRFNAGYDPHGSTSEAWSDWARGIVCFANCVRGELSGCQILGPASVGCEVLLGSDISVCRNSIRDVVSGVEVLAKGVLVEENRIAAVSGSFFGATFAMFGVFGAQEVRRNRIVGFSLGVLVWRDGAKIVDNLVRDSPGAGIMVGLPEEAGLGANAGLGSSQALAPENCELRGNQIARAGSGIVLCDADRTVVTRNRIVQCPEIGIQLDGASECELADNTLRELGTGIALESGVDNLVAGNLVESCKWGITAYDQTDLRVLDNRVSEVGGAGFGAIGLVGRAVISRNRLSKCGEDGDVSVLGIGIGVLFGFGEVVVESNHVLDTGLDPQGPLGAACGIALGPVVACRVAGNLVTHGKISATTAGREDRALLLVGSQAFFLANLTLAFGSAQILGNKFRGPGLTHLVELRRVEITRISDLRFRDVNFSDNHCVHWGGRPEGEQASVKLFGNHLLAIGNHVHSPVFLDEEGVLVPSMDCSNRPKVALLGNVTTGEIINVGSSKPTPHGDFNVRLF